MLVLDTNVLMYAANKDSEFHFPCNEWLSETRRDPSRTFLTWSVCYEFTRVTTHPRALQTPWRPQDVHRFLSELLESPGFELLVQTRRHSALLSQTLSELPSLRGNMMHDLHTAVLMREHGISRICTRDRDSLKFPFLTVIDPLQQPTDRL